MNNKILILLCMILISFSFVTAVSITDVSSSPIEVVPGEIIDITLEIENIFNYDVTNLNVKLILSDAEVPFAPYQSSSEKFLDNLDKGDEEDFKFKLITLPDTSTGIYKIPVEITYNYEDDNLTLPSLKSELISVTVNSEPKLKVSLDDSIVLIKGKENTFRLKIINSGLSDAQFLYVTISNVSGLKFLNEKEQYLGDIDSDDFDNVEYNVIINEDASSSITFTVTLKFMDATNKEFIETTTLVLNTYSLKEAREIGIVDRPKITPYIVVFILIIGYIFYRIEKKRKLKKRKK
ncbi:hypothetical protein KAI04_02040 [Candidatus Pacearchaeota archaeon]|nr:hypothetical protein [Candidatus Pacearchaeota archaeon]